MKRQRDISYMNSSKESIKESLALQVDQVTASPTGSAFTCCSYTPSSVDNRLTVSLAKEKREKKKRETRALTVTTYTVEMQVSVFFSSRHLFYSTGSLEHESSRIYQAVDDECASLFPQIKGKVEKTG